MAEHSSSFLKDFCVHQKGRVYKRSSKLQLNITLLVLSCLTALLGNFSVLGSLPTKIERPTEFAAGSTHEVNNAHDYKSVAQETRKFEKVLEDVPVKEQAHDFKPLEGTNGPSDVPKIDRKSEEKQKSYRKKYWLRQWLKGFKSHWHKILKSIQKKLKRLGFGGRSKEKAVSSSTPTTRGTDQETVQVSTKPRAQEPKTSNSDPHIQDPVPTVSEPGLVESKSSELVPAEKSLLQRLRDLFNTPTQRNTEDSLVTFRNVKYTSFYSKLVQKERGVITDQSKFNKNILLYFTQSILGDDGKIIKQLPANKFKTYLKGFNTQFAVLELSEEEKKEWIKLLSLLGKQAIGKTLGNGVAKAREKYLPYPFIQEIKKAALINNKLNTDELLKTRTKEIYDEIVRNESNLIHLDEGMIDSEVDRIKLYKENVHTWWYHSEKAPIFGGSVDENLLSSQARDNPFILEGIKIFNTEHNSDQKAAAVGKLIKAIRQDPIFDESEERFLALKFIYWAFQKEKDAEIKNQIKYKVADLALDSFLYLPESYPSDMAKYGPRKYFGREEVGDYLSWAQAFRLITPGSVTQFKDRTVMYPSRLVVRPNGKLVYPDWVSPRISQIHSEASKDASQFMDPYASGDLNVILNQPNAKNVWPDVSWIATHLMQIFEKPAEIALKTNDKIEIPPLVISEDWEIFKNYFSGFPKLANVNNFLLEYNYPATPKAHGEMIKYATLKSQIVDLHPIELSQPLMKRIDLNTRGLFWLQSEPPTERAQKKLFESQKIVWLQIVAAKLGKFTNKESFEFYKLLNMFSIQLLSVKNSPLVTPNVKATIAQIEGHLLPISEILWRLPEVS